VKLKLDENLSRHLKSSVAALGHQFVMAFLQQQNLTEMDGCLVVVDPNRIRVRKPQD
jgi:hypothetical protein